MIILKPHVFFLCFIGPQVCFYQKPNQVLPSTQDHEVLEKRLEQNLDHSSTDSGTFFQQYFEIKTFYNGSGNFFLWVGGESPITKKWIKYYEWYRLAEKFRAAMFQLEHRYYGESRPYKNYSTPNLRYLTSKYAIEDIAYFITKINEEYNATTTSPKWILFGGSYAGSLAVWSRLKYSHLIRGVVASSAPLLAKLDFFEYFEVVTETLKTHNDQCVTDIQTAIVDLDHYFSNKNVRAINSATLKFCNKSLDMWEDITYFFFHIAIFFGRVVVAGKKNITDVCDYMTNKSNGDNEVERLSGLLINDKRCVTSYEDYVEVLKTEEYDEARLWRYQTCREFGFFQTLNSPKQIFGNKVSVDFYTNLCVDVFGSKFNSNVTNRNIEYSNRFGGGKNIEISNVVLVNGKLDPWHPLGIYETQQKDPVVIFISDTTHCEDMLTDSENNSEELKKAKEKVESFVGKWLQDNTNSSTLCTEKSMGLLILLTTIIALEQAW